jgi:hypothetical protein
MKGSTLAALGVAQVVAALAQAQEPMNHATPDSVRRSSVAWSTGARAEIVGTIVSPSHTNRTLREGYLSQPMLMGALSALDGRLGLEAMIDFEGITLERGELDTGIYGEGYVDRRHPHTYLHELVASTSGALSRSRLSAAFGKGFVPFGTDDPMVRPFEKYPVNHHIAQVVERVFASLALRHGAVLLEAARFNGDEPESPSDGPNTERLWDSWSTRASLLPTPALEAQVSVARVESPEFAPGGGLDQRKVNVSVRFESQATGAMRMGDGNRGEMSSEMQMADATKQWRRYALLEWGRSSDYADGVEAFSFSTMLAEGEVSHRGLAFAVRLERTERPEEERLADSFRTQRPATDFSILGRTRWDIVSARLSATAHRPSFARVAPFVEISRQHATALVRGAVFDPKAFYGSNSMWNVSAGLSISAGMIHRRTGRYGAAATESTGMFMAGTVRRLAVSETKPVTGSHSR